jgi:hypothetical protein
MLVSRSFNFVRRTHSLLFAKGYLPKGAKPKGAYVDTEAFTGGAKRLPKP